jgi:hypothetical protein
MSQKFAEGMRVARPQSRKNCWAKMAWEKNRSSNANYGGQWAGGGDEVFATYL